MYGGLHLDPCTEYAVDEEGSIGDCQQPVTWMSSAKTTVDDIPDEILGRIFELLPEVSWCYDWGESNIPARIPRVHNVVCVCRRWREVVDSSFGLWTLRLSLSIIPINTQDPGMNRHILNVNEKPRWESALSHPSPSEISLYLYLPPISDQDLDGADWDTIRYCLDLLIVYSHRIVEMSISMPEGAAWRALSGSLCQITFWPRLRSIFLDSPGRIMGEYVAVSDTAMVDLTSASSLEDISANGVAIHNFLIPPAKLTTLRIRDLRLSSHKGWKAFETFLRPINTIESLLIRGLTGELLPGHHQIGSGTVRVNDLDLSGTEHVIAMALQLFECVGLEGSLQIELEEDSNPLTTPAGLLARPAAPKFISLMSAQWTPFFEEILSSISSNGNYWKFDIEVGHGISELINSERRNRVILPEGPLRLQVNPLHPMLQLIKRLDMTRLTKFEIHRPYRPERHYFEPGAHRGHEGSIKLDSLKSLHLENVDLHDTDSFLWLINAPSLQEYRHSGCFSSGSRASPYPRPAGHGIGLPPLSLLVASADIVVDVDEMRPGLTNPSFQFTNARVICLDFQGILNCEDFLDTLLTLVLELGSEDSDSADSQVLPNLCSLRLKVHIAQELDLAKVELCMNAASKVARVRRTQKLSPFACSMSHWSIGNWVKDYWLLNDDGIVVIPSTDNTRGN